MVRLLADGRDPLQHALPGQPLQHRSRRTSSRDASSESHRRVDNAPVAHPYRHERRSTATRDGDINQFWQDRNYNLNVGNVHAAVFESHGLNDDNVRPNHFAQWWAGLTANNVPRKLWLSQEGHVDPFDYRRATWVDTLHRWFDYWLQGVPNGIMSEPQVDIETAPNTWETQATGRFRARSRSTSSCREPLPAPPARSV